MQEEELLTRDRDLFNDARVKEEFLCVMDRCNDTRRFNEYLKRISYYGCIGESGPACENQAAVRDYVESTQDPHFVDEMYCIALEFFATYYKQPRSSKLCYGSLNGASLVEFHPLRETRMLEIGRAGSRDDWHHVARASLYGYTRKQLKTWPMAGVYVKKTCHHCHARNSASLIECAQCHDAFYCSLLCQEQAQQEHRAYCLKWTPVRKCESNKK